MIIFYAPVPPASRCTATYIQTLKGWLMGWPRGTVMRISMLGIDRQGERRREEESENRDLPEEI